jgi:hypothetical protein
VGAFALDNNIAYLSRKSFQQGEYVPGGTCRKKKGDTWVIRTELTEDNADPKELTAGRVESRTSY